MQEGKKDGGCTYPIARLGGCGSLGTWLSEAVSTIDTTEVIQATRPEGRRAGSMSHRPTVFSLTTMHAAGMRLLLDGAEVRMASALDPETLRREVVGADGLIIRTGGVVDAA